MAEASLNRWQRQASIEAIFQVKVKGGWRVGEGWSQPFTYSTHSITEGYLQKVKSEG